MKNYYPINPKVFQAFNKQRLTKATQTLNLSYSNIKSILYPNLTPLKQKVLIHLLNILTNQLSTIQSLLLDSNSTDFPPKNLKILSEEIALLLNLTCTKKELLIYSSQNSFTLQGNPKTNFIKKYNIKAKQISFTIEPPPPIKKKYKIRRNYLTINSKDVNENSSRKINNKNKKKNINDIKKKNRYQNSNNNNNIRDSLLSNSQNTISELYYGTDNMSRFSFQNSQNKTEINENLVPRIQLNKMLYNTYKMINNGKCDSVKRIFSLSPESQPIHHLRIKGGNSSLNEKKIKSKMNMFQHLSLSQGSNENLLTIKRCKSDNREKIIKIIKTNINSNTSNIKNKRNISVEETLNYENFKKKTNKDNEISARKPSNYARYLVKKYEEVVDKFEKLNREEEQKTKRSKKEEEQKLNKFAIYHHSTLSKSQKNIMEDNNISDFINRRKRKMIRKMGVFFSFIKKNTKPDDIDNDDRIIIKKQK